MNIEQQIEEKQREIQNLTEMRPPTPLPAVPMIPNLARGSDEMWQIYQYELSEYQHLKSCASEQDFLKMLIQTQTQTTALIKERLDLLDRKNRAVLPILLQPITRVKPLSYPDKVERAKLIAKHLIQERDGNEGYDTIHNLEKIKELQVQLMDLEEQYHNT
jgi:hypothetical protein